MGGLSGRFFRPGLTGVRALAAGWVMLFHIGAAYGSRRATIGIGDFLVDVTPLITLGWVGVNLFFVLSGFLLTTHLLEQYDPANPGPALRRYAKNRFLRVFPAYWAQIAILLAISWSVNHAPPDWVRFLPLHAFMAHNVTVDSSWAINGVYWTLPIELDFYLCLPALVSLVVAKGMEPRTLVRRMAVVLAVTIAMAIIYRIAVLRLYQDSLREIGWALLQVPGSLEQFALGMMAAALFRKALIEDRGAARRERLATLLFIVGIGGTVAMMYWMYNTPDYWGGSRLVWFWYTLTCTLLAMLVFAIAISSPVTRALFENGAVVWLGSISYSIYLWHFPIVELLGRDLDRARVGRIEFALAVLAATLVASSLSYYLVERPFLRKGAGVTPKAS